MKELLMRVSSVIDEKKAEVPLQEVEKEEGLNVVKDLEIIIVSDNHRVKKGLEKVLERYTDADCFLHCGDSNLDRSTDVMRPFVTVRGNTDYQQGYAEDEFVELESGVKIWVTHGHRYSVNNGTADLVKSAKNECSATMVEIPPIDIIAYGHTHKVDVKMQDGFLVINPGSIAKPRDGSQRTYGRLLIKSDCYEVQIFDVSDHSIIKEFLFPRG